MIKFERNTYDGFLVYSINPSTVSSNMKQIQLFSSKVIEYVAKKESISIDDVLTNRIYHLHDDYYCFEMIFCKELKIKTLSFLMLMKKVSFLDIEEVTKLNKDADKIFHEDGFYGLKDVGLVENLLYNVEYSEAFGVDHYPTLVDKAAHLWFIIARYQAFHNGNKRTGMLATLTFLRANFYDIETESSLENDLYNISMDIALEKMKEKDVVDFLIGHIKINFDGMNSFYKKLSEGENDEGNQDR